MIRFLLIALLALVCIGAPAQAATTPVTHVILIMEENHSRSAITGTSMPYLTSLASKYGQEANESAITHPSLPNYMSLTAGNDIFNGSDCAATSCRTGADNIFHQTQSWRVWAESEPSNCDHGNASPYAVRHTAAPYFTDLTNCQTSDIPLDASHIPGITTGQFILVTPNLNDDAHDGTLGQADTWLRKVVGTLLTRKAFTDGSTLIEVTFDEGSGTNQVVETVFIHPSLNHVTISTKASHYSLLRLNEELLGLPLLAHAQTAPDYRASLGL